MSNALLNNTKFRSKTKEFFARNKSKILDIVLFGSAVKGKNKPEDIDILIIHKDKKDFDVSYELKKSLNSLGLNIQVIDKTYPELFKESFQAREGILAEGYSLVYEQPLSAAFGYISFILFKYELKGFNKSGRMRFYYSLYGRDNTQEGMLKKLKAIKFSNTIILCPMKSSEELKEYLNTWKLQYIEFPILIPSRLKSIMA